ncbi:hypothetical protein [Capnocytophaga canis]|uniref:hypothetical protein n=1 Tax=Capnocytophaga canis TaxID=1848903 RepID=UPI00385F46EC
MEGITIEECFHQILKKRAWYKNSPYDRKSAFVHKKKFLEGTLSRDIIRIYLQSSGYVVVQQELWNKKEVYEKRNKGGNNIITE